MPSSTVGRPNYVRHQNSKCTKAARKLAGVTATADSGETHLAVWRRSEAGRRWIKGSARRWFERRQAGSTDSTMAARSAARQGVSFAAHAIRNRPGQCRTDVTADFVIYDTLVSITWNDRGDDVEVAARHRLDCRPPASRNRRSHHDEPTSTPFISRPA